MTVLVAVPEGREGPQALDAGITEARLLDTDLVVLNLTLSTIDVSGVPEDLKVTLLERSGPGDRDPADAVLDEIADRPDVSRLVIGLRRRSPVSKALLGSISQRLLLESPIPVLAVKPED
ncbi:universal stress protein [Actinomycetospora callitridis]|jgi:nucleotide-binding universal stress UspA family protein|uniref:universal stress protein n=1 Tax=Actinomycetospora callitridis TaxID=913944 RepID=UPI0023655DD4|nr:universal stress protein [Actinomycetospora callitridis]MDD7917216.1 universal stress protein [Actinomycetospora callitridis]